MKYCNACLTNGHDGEQPRSPQSICTGCRNIVKLSGQSVALAIMNKALENGGRDGRESLVLQVANTLSQHYTFSISSMPRKIASPNEAESKGGEEDNDNGRLCFLVQCEHRPRSAVGRGRGWFRVTIFDLNLSLRENWFQALRARFLWPTKRGHPTWLRVWDFAGQGRP